MVSSEILNKPGPLNDEEWETMRRHTIEGEQMLGTVPELAEVAELVRACHERYDGDGYPEARRVRTSRSSPARLLRRRLSRDALIALTAPDCPVEEALDEMKCERRAPNSIPWSWPPSATFTRLLAIQLKAGPQGMYSRSGARARKRFALLATLT